MKKVGIVSCMLLISSVLMSNTSKQVVKSKIKGVTVYLSGAQIKRSGKITFKKGVSYVRFEGVSPYLNPKTIQIKGTGAYTILDVKKSVRYPEPAKQEVAEIPKSVIRSIKRVNDSITKQHYLIRDVTNKLGFLKIEKGFLLKNNVFTNDSLAVLDQSLDFLRKKLYDINANQLDLQKNQDRYKAALSKMEARLADLRNYQSNNKPAPKNNAPIHFVEIALQALQSGSGNLNISYFVKNAGWSPLYDIKVENTSSPVELTMKANIYQNSGEDWDEVPLTLSTNNPFKNKIKPELQVWYLNYYYANRGYMRRASEKVMKDQAKSAKMYEDNAESLDEISITGGVNAPAGASNNYTVQKNLMASANYTIPLPYTVKSNNQAHMVAVKNDKIKSDYYHYLVPKYDTDAYIVAKLVDWEELDLLPAKANIFYDGTYIGETRINPTANDTLSLSLGNDPRVVIKRTRNRDKTKEKVFTNQKEKTISYDMIVKNKTSGVLKVIIEDQIPVANDKTIKVSLESKSGASFNEDKGLLKWSLKVKGYNSKKLNYTYRIKYDKVKQLNANLL